MALLTKSIGIVTPLILSIVVVVALRLISYKKELPDHIVQVRAFRSYRTWASGYGGKRKKETMQSDVSACLGEVQPKRNITSSSGSTSTVMSLILIHENTQPGPIDNFDALIDPSPGQASSATP